MTDKENKALYISEALRKAGVTLAGAAGIIANIEAESAFSSINVEDRYHSDTGKSDADYVRLVDSDPNYDFVSDNGRHYGMGLAQWTLGSRKAKMLAYHKARGKSIGDFQTQVDFLIDEMRTGEYQPTFNLCCTSNNPYECGYQVCMKYERPANTEQQSQYRGSKAVNWYTWLTQHMDETISISEEPQQETPATDEDGIAIPQTWPPRMIDRRCEGFPEIKLLQAALVCHGYNVLVDGIFGAALTAKVNQFQSDNGLAADGCVGPMTWRKLLTM